MKRKNKERGKERATKKYLLFPGERRWLFAENGGIISYFPLFLAHIWGATQYLCYWDTSEMHLSAAPPTYNGITVLGVFKQFKVIQPSSHLPLASCWTVKLLFGANLPSLALAGPLMSNTALIIIDSPQSVYQKDIWFLSVLFRKGNEVKWRFLLMQPIVFLFGGPARKKSCKSAIQSALCETSLCQAIGQKRLARVQLMERSWIDLGKSPLTFKVTSHVVPSFEANGLCVGIYSAGQGRAIWSINIPQLPTRGAARTQSGMTSVRALKGPICNTNKWACLVFCFHGLARRSCNYGNPGCRVALLIGWQLQQHH